MCGICGWFVLWGAPQKHEADLARMASHLRHRGPDESGVFLHAQAALAIRRLKVLDLHTGQQPYYNEDLSICAVFNGEIYNFQELRRRLEARGHAFKSHTDGEVIVHLYEEYGPDLVDHLNGMFALALWDEPRQRFLLARDRLGIKPLYYSLCDNLLVFASEPKAILASEALSARLNPLALDQYLTFEYVPGPMSIFERIAKLEPGCRLLGQDGQFQVDRYWRPLFEPAATGSLEDWGEGLAQRLREAVRRQIVSDVPVGLFLSGGVDSSSLAALMSQESPGQLKTFSIGFAESSYDESSFSELVAREFATDHHQSRLNPQDIPRLLPPLIDVLDEPLADPAVVPTYLLSRFARSQVTVALAGEGADELLGGYPTYPAHSVAERILRLPPPWVRWIAELVHRLPVSRHYLSLDFKLKRFFGRLEADPARRHQLWMGAFTPQEKEQLYTPDFQAQLRGADGLEPLDSHRRFLDSLGNLERAQYLDLCFYLPDGLLVKLDRATMAVSLEGRVPYLDNEVVDYALRLPSRAKLRGFSNKLVLKQAMRAQLPERVRRRAKKGFGLPLARWFTADLAPLLDQELDSRRLAQEGLFRPEAVARLLADHRAGRMDNRKQLWTLLMFQMWRRRFLDH